ncbi:MAG: histidine kinase [Bacteroidota bacterium]
MLFSRRNLVAIVIVFLLGGIFEIALLCTGCLSRPYLFSSMFFIRWLYSGLNWVLLWKGSELIVDILNRFVPWVESPLKRLIASLMGIFLVVFFVVWGLDIFFDTLFLGKTLSQALEASSAPYINVLVVTLIVNVFMHGRGFLLGWRQASIDMERLKIEQISTRYESLKNQVNPHFLFNSLNALSSLVYDDQAKAVEFIRRLSQVYRYVLDKREQELVTVDEELTFAQDFIFLQKIRFGENLQVTISNEEKEKGFLPPLALQLLVENAIKHNVVSERYPLKVVISLGNEVCVVENNVKEKLSKDSTGIGLNNLKERYKYLTDRKVEIEKTDQKFIVSLPILKVVK